MARVVPYFAPSISVYNAFLVIAREESLLESSDGGTNLLMLRRVYCALRLLDMV